MTSFFKNLKNNYYYNQEQFIKENLITQLYETVKEIQFEHNKNEDLVEYSEQKDCINTLCTLLESIFLHGLKDSLLWQTLSIISSNDVDRKPEPNFWPLLLVFLHAHTIEEIEKLTQIKTDIGNCRSWIRLTLNESLFSSYIKIIRKNSSALNPYYKSYAFLKDSEKTDIASTILQGLEASVKIKLHVNSTLLNQWPVQPLQLAGLYKPPLRSCPIAKGVDVANSMTDSETIPIPKPLKTNEVFPNSISNSPFNKNVIPTTTENQKDESDSLSEEENVQIFLEKIQEFDQPKIDDINSASNTVSVQSQTLPYYNTNSNNVQGSGCSYEFSFQNVQNDDLNAISDQTSKELKTDFKNQKLSRSNSMNSSTNSLRSSFDKYSYDALLIKHQRNNNDKESNINDEWRRFENSLALTSENSLALTSENTLALTSENSLALTNETENEITKLECSSNESINNEDTNAEKYSNNLEDVDNFGFEILQNSVNATLTLSELKKMVNHTYKLAREQGLDAQGYMCKGCAHPLGIDFANAHVCGFSGYYFCEQCMSPQQFVIPAKIIYNWDFRKYYISNSAATFLTLYQDELYIDLKIYNPKIYEASDEMAILQSLRIQLNFIRAYFYTCCESSIQALKKQINSKDYLYEHIHQYSIADLSMIPKGHLMRLLQKTYQFGEEHILKCNLCSMKGFICEICESPRVLYPFHIKTTFRCELCGAVFHDHCLDQTKPCPKCKRKDKRENLPLLEAVHLL